MKTKWFCLLLVFSALLLGMSGNALAQTVGDITIIWNNGAADRDWDNQDNWGEVEYVDSDPPGNPAWSDPPVPGVPAANKKTGVHLTGDNAPLITDGIAAATKELDIGGTLDMDGGTLAVNSWFLIGYGNTAEGTFNLSGGTFTQPVNRTAFGFNGTGNLNVSGGSMTITNQLRFGENPTGTGNATIDGGSVLAKRIEVGATGTGNLTLNDGTVSTVSGQDVYIGYSIKDEGTPQEAPRSVGHVTVNGGTLSPGRDIKVGDRGEGHLTINDGLVDTRNIISAYHPTANGYITMAGGALDVTDFILGRQGGCEMTMSAGLIENVDDMEIGQQVGGSGLLTMTGGEISFQAGDGHNMLLGNAAGSEGEIVMSDGLIDIGQILYVGHNGTGTLTMTGGEINVGGPLVVSRNDGSEGSVYLDGGTLSANGFEMQKGPLGTATPLLDITEGTLILNDGAMGAFNTYTDDGYVKAYGGTGFLLFDDTTLLDKTIITAVDATGDINRDRSVDDADLNLLNSNYDETKVVVDWTAPYGPDELEALLGNYGLTVPASSAASVPEPASMVLVLFGMLGLLGLRRRR